MSAKTIVVVLQESSSTHREITELDHAADAERFIEGLLEKGFEPESIRVLAAHVLDFQVVQKPAVSLLPADRTSQLDQPTQSDLVPMGATESSEPYTRDGIKFSPAFVRESLGQRGDPTQRRYGPFGLSAASP